MISLDHVGLAYKHLERGRDLFSRLGFRLTPQSRHYGAIKPGGPIVPWGSANCCAMLRRGYIEVLGIVAEDLHSSIATRLRRYEGGHIVAIRCGDSHTYFAERKCRIPSLTRPVRLTREVVLRDNNVPDLVSFSNCYVNRDEYPEAQLLVIEHLTPELLWVTPWLSHPNTAEEIAGVGLRVVDFDEAVSRYSSLLETEDMSCDKGTVTYYLPGGGYVRLFDECRLSLHFRDSSSLPAAPAVISVEVAVSDVKECVNVLTENSVSYVAYTRGSIEVSDDMNVGCQVRFSPVHAGATR